MVARVDKVDSSAVRVGVEHRRQPGSSERLLKQRLILFAVVAALCAGVVLNRRRTIVFAQSGRFLSSLWVPQSGRAPPLFSF
jgi:hypothetical protein